MEYTSYGETLTKSRQPSGDSWMHSWMPLPISSPTIPSSTSLVNAQATIVSPLSFFSDQTMLSMPDHDYADHLQALASSQRIFSQPQYKRSVINHQQQRRPSNVAPASHQYDFDHASSTLLDTGSASSSADDFNIKAEDKSPSSLSNHVHSLSLSDALARDRLAVSATYSPDITNTGTTILTQSFSTPSPDANGDIPNGPLIDGGYGGSIYRQYGGATSPLESSPMTASYSSPSLVDVHPYPMQRASSFAVNNSIFDSSSLGTGLGSMTGIPRSPSPSRLPFLNVAPSSAPSAYHRPHFTHSGDELTRHATNSPEHLDFDSAPHSGIGTFDSVLTLGELHSDALFTMNEDIEESMGLPMSPPRMHNSFDTIKPGMSFVPSSVPSFTPISDVFPHSSSAPSNSHLTNTPPQSHGRRLSSQVVHDQMDTMGAAGPSRTKRRSMDARRGSFTSPLGIRRASSGVLRRQSMSDPSTSSPTHGNGIASHPSVGPSPSMTAQAMRLLEEVGGDPEISKKSRGRRVPNLRDGSVVTPMSGSALDDSALDDSVAENDDDVILHPSTRGRGKKLAPLKKMSRRSSANSVGKKAEEPSDPSRPHVCPICFGTFARSEHLKRHLRSLHSENKPNVCEYPGCGKTFSRKDNLRQHMQTHSKGKGAGSSNGRSRARSAASAAASYDDIDSEPPMSPSDESMMFTFTASTSLPVGPSDGVKRGRRRPSKHGLVDPEGLGEHEEDDGDDSGDYMPAH
ncbi:zf-C2H2 Zinc finger, C2H2 type [Tulasnella sp. 418]|nr:zf-C2H2 Zinc finger, C2H2 type [Tulasnella sp. 418]